LKNPDLNTESVCDWPIKDDNAFNYQSEPTAPQSEEGSLLSPKLEIIEPEEAQCEVKEENSLGNSLETKEPTSSIQTDPENERGTAPMQLSESSEVLARSWAIQYEEMSPTQRILARKAIADILFEGCMGNLRVNRGEQQSTVANHF